MADKIEQSSGDNSLNIQIGGNANFGLTATEARQIALDVFKANFYDFSERAAKKALERAEEITDNFIEQVYSKIPHLEDKIQEPGVQYSIFNIQKEYAKTGDNNLKEQLVSLLVQRIGADERSLKQIVLDEAITIIPKLTKHQIDTLSLIFSAVCLNHFDILNIPSLIKFLNNRLLNFYSQNISYSFFTHLQFTGCCTLLSEGSSYKPFEQILKNRYKALFIKGFNEQELKTEFAEEFEKLKPLLIRCMHNSLAFQFSPLNDQEFKSQSAELNLNEIGDKALYFQGKFLMTDAEIVTFCSSINALFSKFLSDWQEKDFKTIRLASVGFAIAILNYNQTTGENVPVEAFI